MIDLKAIQQTQFAWQVENFDCSDLDRVKLMCSTGAAEEVGELCHAVLKDVQNIREGTDKALIKEMVADAAGDIVIYVMGVCNFYGIDFEDALRETAAKVFKRDWVGDPESGGG